MLQTNKNKQKFGWSPLSMLGNPIIPLRTSRQKEMKQAFCIGTMIIWLEKLFLTEVVQITYEENSIMIPSSCKLLMK